MCARMRSACRSCQAIFQGPQYIACTGEGTFMGLCTLETGLRVFLPSYRVRVSEPLQTLTK